SALQAPVRMLAHTVFVFSALTGLRLEWRSPPRQTQSVGWLDATTRIGLTTLPVLALSLWLLPGVRDGAWTLLPVLLPLALAVPMVVFSGHAGLGAVARRMGILSVAEDRHPPRPLARARSTLAFAALQPRSLAVAQPALTAKRSAPWGGAWAAAAVAALLVTVAPRTAITPEAGLSTQTRLAFERFAGAPTSAPVQVAALANTIPAASAQSKPRSGPVRPARYIDNALRARAKRAVERALAQDDSA
ncbi:MAG: glucans biosynthesis glucosyltransferase MdoH, partial [Burkholderiaceae bacterium]